jgi:gamma-glutamylcyclotransferase (GGCT)/AIG2-like uncharacterized protein YtfP
MPDTPRSTPEKQPVGARNVDAPPVTEDTTTLLFQYGSNMSSQVLQGKIEQHLREFAPAGTEAAIRLIGPAKLKGWRVVFDLFSSRGKHRVIDIVEGHDAAAEVWGALYELSIELVCRTDKKRSVLDRIEGYRTSQDPANYEPRRVTVEVGDRKLQAWTYVGSDAARERIVREHPDAPMSADYTTAITDGAAALGLPAHYRKMLQRLCDEPSRYTDEEDVGHVEA